MLAIAGTQQASIAWPDRPAERYIVDDFARHGIEEIVTLEGLAEEKHPTVTEVLEKHGILRPSSYTKAPADFIDAMTNAPGGDIAVPDLDGVTIAADGTVTPAPGTEIVPDGEGGAAVVDVTQSAQETQPPQPTNEPPAITEAQAIRNYLAEHGSGIANKEVVAALATAGIKVTSSQVSAAKKEMAEAKAAE